MQIMGHWLAIPQTESPIVDQSLSVQEAHSQYVYESTLQ